MFPGAKGLLTYTETQGRSAMGNNENDGGRAGAAICALERPSAAAPGAGIDSSIHLFRQKGWDKLVYTGTALLR